MLAVTSDDLNGLFRQEVADVIRDDATDPVDADRLWKDVEVYSYMTEAADAVARETLGLYKLVQVPVRAGVQAYTLPLYVLEIRNVRLISAGRTLCQHNINEYGVIGDDDYGQQVVGSANVFTVRGTPTQYMRDYDTRAIRLIPIPTVDDTLELQCAVTIPAPLSAGMAMPFRESVDQRLMLLKMKALAYAKHDIDTFDTARSEAFAAEFETKAAARKAELLNYRRKPGVVRMEW